MKWAAKILVKLLLARLPLPYSFWKSVGLFRHGRMDTTDYSFKIFKMHVARANPDGLPTDSVILELGPGDSIASAIIGRAYGAKDTYLVDVDSFANKKVSFYQSLIKYLNQMGLRAPDLSMATSFEDILKICRAEYLTNGITSLKTIPSQSVDFIWSHSVLEHIRKKDFQETILNLRRILKPGSYASHNIDFQDHLDHSLNNLRFPEKVWESNLFVGSGFYTNRVPALVMHRNFEVAGFEIIREEFGKWETLSIPRSSMNPAFQNYQDQDLINRTSHVLLKA